ncbi:MAG: transposase [Methylobacter sp.]|uniref:Transposase n=1 Tax=Candidatus Methylobacter titanis TaxID=3053457 RepID=A0AA43TLN6_9GAMM|nr:transposase [Candidatus Methylobacter titanis]
MPDSQLRIGRHSEPHRAYFVTTTLDERKQRYFADFHCARLVVKEMRFLHGANDVNSLAWVIMPDHVHWLFQLTENKSLSDVMKYFKARSAQRVNGYLKRQGRLWQNAFHDHAIRKDEDIKAIARYIVANPLRGGLVEHIGDYSLWDAIWL